MSEARFFLAQSGQGLTDQAHGLRGASGDRSCDRSRILGAAYAIDRDVRANWRWYREDAIQLLGGQTAQALVDQGRGHEVLQFLLRVADQERAALDDALSASVASPAPAG